jgi:hypothetical protein
VDGENCVKTYYFPDLLLEGNKIRFEINLGAVNAAKLKMSAPADAGENGYWDCGGKLGGVLS